MLFECIDDGVDDVPMGAVAALHVDVRFLVGRSPLGIQPVEDRLAIAASKLCARSIHALTTRAGGTMLTVIPVRFPSVGCMST